VFVMKLVILLSEIGSLLILRKLLLYYKLPASRSLLYALNPLVILELNGNVHMEAIMIFFLLLGILFLVREKLILSGIAISLAICVKLIPLILLPALLPRLGWKKAFIYYSIVGLMTLLLFLPLLDENILAGFQNSLSYYFKKFEFNASIYYLVREWGYWYYGYNIIQTAGWLLGAVSASIILYISFVSFNSNSGAYGERKLLVIFLFVMLSYFLFTTTLHPWYITTLFVFLTYAGYSANDYSENLWLVAIEYLSVLGYLAYEFLWKRKESLLRA
jgi:alpha-1,6-mannosyltransferase